MIGSGSWNDPSVRHSISTDADSPKTTMSEEENESDDDDDNRVPGTFDIVKHWGRRGITGHLAEKLKSMQSQGFVIEKYYYPMDWRVLPTPQIGDTMILRYKGWLWDPKAPKRRKGTSFDKGNVTAIFGDQRAIPGWTAGKHDDDDDNDDDAAVDDNDAVAAAASTAAATTTDNSIWWTAFRTMLICWSSQQACFFFFCWSSRHG